MAELYDLCILYHIRTAQMLGFFKKKKIIQTMTDRQKNCSIYLSGT